MLVRLIAKSEMLYCAIRGESKIMGICFAMITINLLILLTISFLVGPLPVWVGGIIGVSVFLVVGSLVARFVE